MRTAAVLGAGRGWGDQLERAEVDVVGRPEQADLVVASAASLAAALEAEPPAIIVEGGVVAPLRSAGYHVSRFLALADEIPGLLVPLDERRLARYALVRLRRPSSLRGRVRQLADGVLPRAAPVARSAAAIAVAERTPPDPFLVRAARRQLVPDAEGWLLAVNEARKRARDVFHLFAAGSSTPSWVIKFQRVGDAVADDGHGLALAAAAGGEVAAHTPSFLGRFVEAGVPASVETAATGVPLNALLRAPLRRGRKVALIDGVAAWLSAVARRTGRPAEGELERQFSEEDLVRVGLDAGARAGVGGLPAVLQHFDLAAPNVLVAGPSFTVVDWEHARFGLPLLDLLRLLETSLPLLDRVGDAPGERTDYLASVFADSHPTSALVARWVREVAAASRADADVLGPLAVLAWLKLGKETLLTAWLRHPRLGVGWRRA